MKIYLLVAAAVALSDISLPTQCSESKPEAEPEPEASPAEREITAEETEAYRQQIESAASEDGKAGLDKLISIYQTSEEPAKSMA